jgi:alpha-amylase
MGFSGFRIDAAKHISPTNLAAIFGKFKQNLGGSFTDDFITYLEVIIGG